MATNRVYGLGGFDPSKPNNNIISEVEVPDTEEETNVQVLAEALASLDPEKLESLRVALGL
jgi:hypothetical protein